MFEFLDELTLAYGWGFFYLFTIPAFAVCGILVFEVCAAVWAEIRQQLAPSEEGCAVDENGHLVFGFHLAPPETALRDSHYRPLERYLIQPFAKQVNKIRWPGA